jgi:hypothetical protein
MAKISETERADAIETLRGFGIVAETPSRACPT